MDAEPLSEDELDARLRTGDPPDMADVPIRRRPDSNRCKRLCSSAEIGQAPVFTGDSPL